MNYRKPKIDNHIGYRTVALFFIFFSLYIFGRLFYLQIIRHDYYLAAAKKTQEKEEFNVSSLCQPHLKQQ